MAVNPISPDAVVEHKRDKIIPPEVITAFNNQIAKNFSSNYAIVKQCDVINEILVTMVDVTRQQIYNKKWLDIEDIYRAAGWDVYYDRPGWNETYEPTFKFSKGKTDGSR